MKFDRLVEWIYRSRFYQTFFKDRGLLGEQLMLLHPGKKKEQLLEQYHCKKIREFLICCLVCLLLAVCGVVWGLYQRQQLEVSFVERPSYHQGDRQETLEAVRQDGTKETVSLQLSERVYTAAEAKERLKEAMDLLDKAFLGENSSPHRVDLPLVFETEPLEGVVVQWMTDQPDVLNSAGQIADSFAEEAGELVQVRAVIACQQEEAVYTREVMVYPLRKTDGEAFRRKTDHALEKADQESLQEEGFSLPEQIDGETVIFRKRAGKEFWFLSLLLFLAGILLYICRDERITGETEKRRAQLLVDYPGLVNKLTVLMRAGLTVQTAFGRIAMDYRRRKEQEGIYRYAYEELTLSYYEMVNGISEGRACEQYGKRCGLLPYMRLGGLLAQNSRKGNHKLLESLGQESREAFEEQKRRARKTGEEAGTRMLLPMVLMLVVTIVIILYPAFAAFQL